MQFDTVVLATSNPGKIAELAEPLGALGLRVLGLKDFPAIGVIAETGRTFAENALIKARLVAKAAGLPAIADDSGLMVAALNGAPGVFSARYGDDQECLPDESRDQRNIRKLLRAMRGVPAERRGCEFVSVMAAVSPGGSELTVTGSWPGRLLEVPLGENGFGYDPIFWDCELGKTAAQMRRQEKNSVSHRGKAVAALITQWPEFAALVEKE